MKGTHKLSSAGRALQTALQALADNQAWHGLLAENLYWASCEALLQAALLHAFNVSSEQYVADRERALERAWKLDLLIFDRTAHDAWWAARGAQPTNRLALAKLARALVQLKVAWTEGSAYGSAVLPAKARAIASDIDGLTSRQATYPHCEFYWCVLVAGFHPPGEGASALKAAEATLLAALQTRQNTPIKQIPLLDGVAAPHSPSKRSLQLASASLLWSGA